jgi:hypothetical protein
MFVAFQSDLGIASVGVQESATGTTQHSPIRVTLLAKGHMYRITRITGLACQLPYNDHIFVSNELTPDQIIQLNDENQEWMESQSKVRTMERCLIYYEELMHNRLHPDSVFYLRTMGYMPSEM